MALATLVALTVTKVLLVTLGAENVPLLDIVPALADQTTAVFSVPTTLAANCCRPSDNTVMLPGEIVSDGPEWPPATMIRACVQAYSPGSPGMRTRSDPASLPISDETLNKKL